MSSELSANAQAILLLTAPLLAGRQRSSAKPLGAGEYRRLARQLREMHREPANACRDTHSKILDRADRLQGAGLEVLRWMLACLPPSNDQAQPRPSRVAGWPSAGATG